jgi:hypothetical protein
MYGVNEKYVATPIVGESTLQCGEKVLHEHRSLEAFWVTAPEG